jgi:hypothetical protein
VCTLDLVLRSSTLKTHDFVVVVVLHPNPRVKKILYPGIAF